MIVTYQSPDYSPDKVLRRYVRYDGGCYKFCEVGTRKNRSWDLRQGIVDESELPVDVAKHARDRYGAFPSYVAWPL